MTVSMIKKSGGPVTADVHPDEVANWAAAGWRVAGEAISLDDATNGQLVDELQARLATIPA